MRIRPGLAVTAALGAVLLVPVLVVVALGLYGESIGFLTVGSATVEPALSIQPDRALSGSQVLIEGQRWPPRTEISLVLGKEQSGDTGNVIEVPLARITSSRSGTFAIQLTLPPALLSAAADRVQIRAEARRESGEPPLNASVDFSVEPYANVVSVNVTDAETGDRLNSANVLLRDGFGTVLASGRTDRMGIAEFAGITPGNVAAEVRKLDYRTATIELSVAATGPSRAAVLLRADPGKRLLLPFSDILDASRLRIMALDRASGLRADEILNRETAGPTATRRPFPSETHFFYLLPTVKAGAPRTVVSDPRTFESMRAWGLRFAGNLRAIVARVNLLGLSADGDVVLVTEATGAGFGHGSSTWLLLDPETGQETRRGEVLQGSFVAGFSSDRGTLYVIDNSSNQLTAVRVATGDETAVITGLPSNVLRLAPDPSGSAVYLLQAGTGTVFRVDLTLHEISGPMVSVAGATWLSTNRTGTRLYLVGPGLGAMTALYGLDGNPIVRTVPLPGSANWIWADFDGPYLYAGGGEGMDVAVLDAETLEIIDRHSTKSLSSQGDPPPN